MFLNKKAIITKRKVIIQTVVLIKSVMEMTFAKLIYLMNIISIILLNIWVTVQFIIQMESKN